MTDTEKTYCPRCRTFTKSIGDDTCLYCLTEKKLYKDKFRKLNQEIRQLSNKLSRIQEALPPYIEQTDLAVVERKLGNLQETLYQEFREPEDD